jgi:cysteinyl-tRNA synthetase, unknown class
MTKTIAILFFISLLLVSCTDEPDTPTGNNDAESSDPLPLSDIKYWAYQLQGLDEPGAIDKIVNSKYDLVVIEPTRTDWENEQFDFVTKGMVDSIKKSAAHNKTNRKLVIAYINIGEAESWRWYWTWGKEWNAGQPKPADWPSYIVYADPDGWVDNYPVIFWDTLWKNTVIYGIKTADKPYADFNSVLDEVLKDGFDGIYLDWVEAYADEMVVEIAKSLGIDPAAEMVKFYSEMREYAIKRNPKFIIIQQNASNLINDAPASLNYIDAISQEAVWFEGTGGFDNWDDPTGYDTPNDQGLTEYYIINLDKYKSAGKPVFCTEYAVKNAPKAYSNATQKGYVAYCTRRCLSKITTTPPPGM